MCGGAGCSARSSSSTSSRTTTPPSHGRLPSWCRSSVEQCPPARALSHHSASSSSRTTSISGWRRSSRATGSQRRSTVLVKALFEPPPFQPSKLSISFAPGATTVSPAPPASRRYTLTHNDITGQLWLTVGADYNMAQISGFYTRLLRDEVVAEWRSDGMHAVPSLHLFCHVSGEERWLAPPALRNYIFRREMPLVLDCVIHAEQELLKLNPQLSRAPVFVHFQSAVEHLDSIECWGILGERSTWQAVPTSILKRLLFGVLGMQLEPDSTPQKLGGTEAELPLQAGRPGGYSLSPVIAAATLEVDSDDDSRGYGEMTVLRVQVPQEGQQQQEQLLQQQAQPLQQQRQQFQRPMPSSNGNGQEQRSWHDPPHGLSQGSSPPAPVSEEDSANLVVSELAESRPAGQGCLSEPVSVPVAGMLSAVLDDNVAGAFNSSLLLSKSRRPSELMSSRSSRK